MRTNTSDTAPFQPIKQASYLSGMSQYFIRKGILDGKIAHVKSGNKYLVNVPKLLEELNSNSGKSAASN